MSKSIKSWLNVKSIATGVSLEGREFTSDRKRDEGGECYLYLTPREADWLIQQIYDAMPEGTHGVAVVKVRR